MPALAVLLVFFSVQTGAETTEGPCEILMHFGPHSRADLRWEALMDVLKLSPTERDRTNEVLKFFLEAFSQRHEGVALGDLTGPYLDDQARTLVRQQNSLVQDWPKLLEFVEARLAAHLRHATEDVTERERRLRTQSHERSVAEKAAEIKDSLTRIGARHGAKPDVEGTFKNAIDMLSANPERDVFEAKKSLMALQKSVVETTNRLRASAPSALATITALHAKLVAELATGPVTLGRLYRQQWMTAAAFDSVLAYVDALDPSRGRHSFASDFEFDFAQRLVDVRAWLADDARPIDEMEDRLRRMTANFANKGRLVLPVSGQLSKREQLALGFLPLNFIHFDTDERLIDGELRSVSPTEAYLYDHSGYDQGQPPPELADNDPDQWARALTKSWANWLLLLGGKLGSIDSIYQTSAQKAEVEAIIQAILFSVRFHGDSSESPTDWSSLESVVQLVAADFFFLADERRPGVTTTYAVDKLISSGAEYFADLLPPGATSTPFSEKNVVGALDLMLARLTAHPEFSDQAEGVRGLVGRFPNAAVTAKLLVLRMMHPPGQTHDDFEPGSLFHFM